MVERLNSTLNPLFDDPNVLSNPIDLVTSIITVKLKFEQIIDLSFDMDKGLRIELEKTLHYHFGASGREYLGKFLLRYINQFLKKRLKSEEEATNMLPMLHGAASLSTCLPNSESFFDQYKSAFANRALHDQFNEVWETAMLPEMFSEYHVEELLKMLEDIKLSDQNMRGFAQDMDYPEIFVRTLTDPFWPTVGTNEDINLPHEIQVISNNFERYFAGIHDHGTKLMWQTN